MMVMKPSNIVTFLAASAIIAVTVAPSTAFAPVTPLSVSVSASKSSHLAFSASSTMESDYAAVYHHAAAEAEADTQPADTTAAATAAMTDEDLFVASTTLPTFDRHAHAYTNLPTLGSGSLMGEKSMMEELLRHERALADKLEQQLELQQQMLALESSSSSTFFSTSTFKSTKIMQAISFESDGLMMVEKRGHY